MIKTWEERYGLIVGFGTVVQAMQAEIDELRAALAERDAEIERLKLSATYAEHIDATPENRLQTMLHDTLTERDALRKVLEQALVELIECRSVDDNERGRLAAITAIQEAKK